MSVKTIQHELFVEISSEQQQLLSGGQFFPSRRVNPDIIVNGNLTTSEGDQFPVRILGFRIDQQ